MKDTTRAALISAIIPTVGAFAIFFLGDFHTQSTLERDTVQVLSEKFDSIEKNMSYEDALQTIFKENESLKNQLNDQQTQIDQQNSEEEIQNTIQKAIEYGDASNYIQALSILNGIKEKSSEIDSLITDYSQKYESNIIEQVTSLKINEQLDEANNLIKTALNILPNSQIFKNKLQEIENSYPQNMLDVIPAYQCGGNTYTEYISNKSGATNSFSMGGVKYTNGMTFNTDYNIFNEVSWSVYNLNNKYSSLDFTVCHVDGTFNGDETLLQIFYDGELKEEIPLSPDMSPKSISLDVTGVSQLKIQVPASGGDNPEYGIGNPKIK